MLLVSLFLLSRVVKHQPAMNSNSDLDHPRHCVTVKLTFSTIGFQLIKRALRTCYVAHTAGSMHQRKQCAD